MPPPEQKRITDEELKQQYGIHLATRLQSDDPSRQANWADIDDDDDDWAPESIEWTDGTKITLPQAEEAVPLPKVVATPAANDTPSTQSPKPKSPAPSASTSTTVKLGGISGGSGRGLVLKGAVEKPTLVAKPPGPPTPVKSPWAPLPPMEKITPLAVDLQQSQQQQPQQQSRFAQRDPHGFENMPPPPAKEIAADDFSRSWREGGSNANRELFNSQSGRYEPVNENRRGSARNEVNSRQPAVLQRPSQQDQQGPAEPSAAFQTHRASGQETGYGRRRASSTVSGGSGNFVRRMSKGQEMHAPHEVFDTRRGSFVATSESPMSPNLQNASLHQQGQRGYPQQRQSLVSPSVSHASPASAHGQMAGSASVQPPTAPVPFEDEVALQRKIMRESRELARKRRLDEEAREDAERKERIRLKLEAMGPAPERKKPQKDTPKEEKTVLTLIQRDGASKASSPPKPPVIEIDGEVKQYGMMKVHPPESANAMATEPKLAKTVETRPAAKDLRPNGVHPNLTSSEVPETQPLAQESKPAQSWQNPATSGADKFATWSAPISNPTQGRNVWGPPSNDRTLGNGTFDPDLSRLPEMHNSQQSQVAGSGPGPIGPPTTNRANSQYQGRVREQHGQRPAPIGPPQRHQGLTREHQQRAYANSAWNNLPEKLAQEDALAREEQDRQEATRLELQAAGVDTTQPQAIYKDVWRQVSVEDDGTRSGIKAVKQTFNDGSHSKPSSAWNDFASHVGQDEAAERARIEQVENSRRQNEASGVKMDGPATMYKDTWRSVQLENGIRSEILGSATTVHNGSSSTSSPPVRGSRFFPQSKDVRLEDPTVSFARPGSPSPPPPTMAGHPAYDGDTAHPQVTLPRPPPIVRLPPPRVLEPIGPPKQITSFAAAAAAAPIGPPASSPNVPLSYQPRQQGENARHRTDQIGTGRPSTAPAGAGDWQDRINHLIGRRSSPPKSHALSVDSSSKNALELPTAQMSATVSLPNSPSRISFNDNGLFETKTMAEECFEEQEMGSLPSIRLPNKAPEAAWHLAASQTKPLPKKFALVQVTTADPITFTAQITNNGSTIHIFLPGMAEKRWVSVPNKVEPRQKSNGRRQGQPRGGASRHASSNHPRGGKQRDPSSGYSSPGLEHGSASPSVTSSTRGGGRGRGGLGSHWNNHRHASSPASAINV